MRKFKDLTKSEKLMISFIIILLIAIAFNWERVVDGFKKGVKTYTEQPVTK